MTIDSTYDESYAAFLTESQDLLQRIESDLLSLKQDRSPNRVHNLMRSAHTLKGAAASVELDTITQVAHVLEDIFKALYNPDIVIDTEVEALLFEGYECLRLVLMAELSHGQIDPGEIQQRVIKVMSRLQEKLGDQFDCNADLPSSVELGFDVVQSLFDVMVKQRLQELEDALHNGSGAEVEAELRTKADVFLGLAESLNLPGFGTIAQTVLQALEAAPEHKLAIAKLALDDFSQGRTQVLAGDRSQGGAPSAALQALAKGQLTDRPFALPETDIQQSMVVGSSPSLEEAFPVATEVLSLDDLFGDANSIHVPAGSAPQPSHHAPLSSESALLRASREHDQLYQVGSPLQPESSGFSTRSYPAVASVSNVVSRPEDRRDPQRAEPVRVDVEQLKHLDYLAGELLIHQSKQINQDQQFRTVVQELRSSLQQHQQTMYHLQDWIERLLRHVDRGKPGLSSPFPTGFAAGGMGSAATSLATPTLMADFDVLEIERYNGLRGLLRSALNETAHLDQVAEDVDQLTRQARRELEVQRRLLSQTRDDLTALRMYPLKDLLNRFPRLLQQLAEAHGKKVELVLSGTHVPVDRVVAEKLYDPLLHLIRNAFDHGIEPPAERRAQGKSDVGRIEIRANQQGNRTVIEVKDDGRGIDLQRVAQQAIDSHLITVDQAHTLPESALLDLLFQPGFSTAAHLSNLSGRGIGLDVVNNQLQALKGSITVNTTLHQGTTFVLKIPLALTTTKLLVCQSLGFTYALPVGQVEQVVRPAADQLTLLGNERVVLHWQQDHETVIVPVYSLADLVEYAETSAQLSSESNPVHPSRSLRQWIETDRMAKPPILLLQTMAGLRGLQVDQVQGEKELVIRSLGTAITPPAYVYGSCVLGNNRPALAIDAEALLDLTTEVQASPEPPLMPQPVAITPQPPPSLPAGSSTRPAHPAIGPAAPPQLPGTRTVLVIDDSLTLRRNLTSLLQRAGYHVHEAEDGLEALTQLRQHPGIDLIICDIEMPRLNGFEFLSQTQQDPTLAAIPVVMLTSRSQGKHRHTALSLGAVEYFTKPYDQDDLLASIDRFLHPPARP